MNWHIEHHMYAGVPCYNLGKLYEEIKDDMPVAAHAGGRLERNAHGLGPAAARARLRIRHAASAVCQSRTDRRRRRCARPPTWSAQSASWRRRDCRKAEQERASQLAPSRSTPRVTRHLGRRPSSAGRRRKSARLLPRRCGRSRRGRHRSSASRRRRYSLQFALVAHAHQADGHRRMAQHPGQRQLRD